MDEDENYKPGDIVNGHQLNDEGTAWIPVAADRADSPSPEPALAAPAGSSKPRLSKGTKIAIGAVGGVLLVGVLGTAIGIGGGSANPVASEVPTSAPTASQIPTATPTPSPVPSRSPSKPSGLLGVDYSDIEAPTWKSNGVTSRITRALVVDVDNRSAPDGAREECAWEIESSAETDNTSPDLTKCLIVVFEFDVAQSFRDDEARLSPVDLVNGGKTISQASTTSGRPGTTENTIWETYLLPSGKPNGVLFFETGSNTVGWTEHKWSLPTEEFLPGNIVDE